MEKNNSLQLTEEERIKLLELQHIWYSKIEVLFEIVKECKNRTIDFLNSKLELKKSAIRYSYAGTIDYLKKHFQSFGVDNGLKLRNIYRSNTLMKPNSIPVLSYDLSKRKYQEDYIRFDSEYLDRAVGFDLIFDVDSPTKDIMDAHDKSKVIKKILDEYKVPYSLKFSGTRGFHFIIPAEYLPNIPIKERIDEIYNVLNNFRAIHDLDKYIDLSVTNIKGIIKVSYSFDSGNIALPLNDWEFDNFKIDMVKCEYVMKNISIRNRGVRLHTHNLSYEELKRNVEHFIKEYK